MPVYLDPMVNHRRRIGRAGPRWCHMIADSLDELHAMADRIGMRRFWFQGTRASLPHYDIGTDAKRAAAIAAGAIDCDRAVFVQHLRRIRAALQES